MHTNLSKLTALALILLLAGVLEACPRGGAESGNLTGRVVALRNGELVPVADALVTIWPQLPGAKGDRFEAEPVKNLRGLSTTRAGGTFEISRLSSPVTQEDYGLLRDWTYGIEVEVPEYYVVRDEFDYLGGYQHIELEIEEKVVDVLDTTGGIQEKERELHRGSIRKD